MEADFIPWDVHCALMESAVSSFSAVLQQEVSSFRMKTQTGIFELVSEKKLDVANVTEPPLEDNNLRAGQKKHIEDGVLPVASMTAEQLLASVEQDLEVSTLVDVLRSLKTQVNECEKFLRAQSVLASSSPSQPRRDQVARHHLDSEMSRRQSLAHRKATLAAFRKASVAIVSRPSLGSLAEPSRAQVNDKPTQNLTAATAESYFSLDRRDDIVRELNEIGKSGGDVDTLTRLQVAAAGERQLFEETISAMSAVHEQDRVDIDNALVRQRMRLQAAESHVTKLVAAELQRLVASQRQGTVEPAPPRDEDDSDTASSDSDVLESRDIELTRMTDGSIRVSVGLQSEIASPSDLNLESVSTVLKESRAREAQIRESLESMGTILRNLERCNEAFEADFFCASCHASFVDLYLLWPCGHQYCLDCVYRNELQAGGYFCEECQAATMEIPVPNVAVNDVVSRMAFKRSGVHGLFDVINRFRKETFNAESTEKGLTAGLHVGLAQL
jgi:hypothetical protein